VQPHLGRELQRLVALVGGAAEQLEDLGVRGRLSQPEYVHRHALVQLRGVAAREEEPLHQRRVAWEAVHRSR